MKKLIFAGIECLSLFSGACSDIDDSQNNNKFDTPQSEIV